ncbi:hypothetical protein A2703_02440 [Candidatus Collierbacteria bacterium RIFCSPHIGHO2_01_FULL_50_25]|uniref:Major facilitator superfamily (MFS) profile domain-containing protein n=2 Tax=Candidatus Collieribacteriota TaxID=1752725 RepID=A0A1F5EV06_9BACT|nr:MAG: hypothetical protein A2703_02440 [Candidatus Collierbacteria bacterium RIFCSPHIGHO2_01_FULL_50_25]
MQLIKRILGINNISKMAIITFFANLYFYNHVGTLYLQTRGLSLLQVSSIWSIIMAASLLSEVPTGIIADKIGRKWSVVIALAIQALGEFLYLFSSNYQAFVLIAILAGVGYAFSSGASEALVYDSLPEENRESLMKKASGHIGGLYQMAFFVAPILGGLIVSQLILSKFMLAIFLTGISVTVAFLISLTLAEPHKNYHHPEQSPLQIFKGGLKLLLTHKRLQWIVAISVLTASFSGSLLSLYQPYFVQQGIKSSFWIGASLSGASLIAFMLLRYAHKIEEIIGGGWALLLVSLLPGIGYVLLSVTKAPLIIPLFIMTFALTDIKNPLISSYQNANIESHNRATVLSLISMVSKFYVAIMGLVFGRIADYSISLALLSIGVMIVAFSLILKTHKYAYSGIKTS